ncbi:MAG: diguanylate cyclase [Sneathiella sp.]
MPVSAHILVVANQEEKELDDHLKQSGYATTYCSYSAFDAAKSVERSHDLILLMSANLDLTKEVGSSFYGLQCPVLIIGPNPVAEKIQSIPAGYCKMELEKRLASLIRLQVMKREFARRSETTKKYGLGADETATPDLCLKEKEVLLVGGKSDTLGTILLQLDTRCKIHVSQTAEVALEELQEKRFDAMIIVGTGQGDVNLRLCNDVRADSKLFNLPIVFVLEYESNREAAYVHGASDIVINPAEMDNLRARTALLIQQAEYRYSLQQLFKASKPLPVTDGPTGLYSYGFMRAHLESLLPDHQADGKNLSFATLTISNLSEINKEHGYQAGDQILRQVGTIVSFLVRGEDICCRYKSGQFLIALPSTGLEDARIALNRVYGVSRMTDFSVALKDEPIEVTVEMGLAELQSDETVEEAIKRGKGVSMTPKENLAAVS